MFSRACFFHFAIWFGCTLCRKVISAAVEIPRIASKATFALNSAEKLFRLPPIVNLSPFPEKYFTGNKVQIHLIHLSRLLGPLQALMLARAFGRFHGGNL